MLEIVAIILLRRHLATIATRKGRRGLWGVLGPLLWIGCEFTGFVVAALAGVDGLPLYGLGLASALAGAALSYVIVTSLPPLEAALVPAPATGRTPEDIKDNPFA